jgi:hypothetical protein
MKQRRSLAERRCFSLKSVDPAHWYSTTHRVTLTFEDARSTEPDGVATAVQESGKVPRKPYDRLDALVLVKGSHVTRDISDEAVRLGMGAACYILLFVATFPWLLPALNIVAIVGVLEILPAAYIAMHINAAALGDFVHEHWVVPRKLIPEVRYGPRGRTTSANAIRAGTWVCKEKEYAQVRRDYHSAHGRSAPSPLVPYNLVLATYELNRAQQVVAFSDGTSVTWHKMASIIIEDSLEIQALRNSCDDEITEHLASQTEQLIGLLDESGSPTSLLTMAARLEVDNDDDLQMIAQALVVAINWNLITATPTRRQAENTDDALIELKQAGQDWNLASSKFQPLRGKERRSVSTDPEKPHSINIGTFAGILNVGKKISGRHSSSVYQAQISDMQVLSCLQEVLGLEQILWNEPELSEIRRIIEEALARQNPRMPGLKQAVIKLRDLCGDLLKGVLSNGAYALLMHFFG